MVLELSLLFSSFQKEVLLSIQITKPTLFRLVFSFVNREISTITADIKITSNNPALDTQEATVFFPATAGQPALTTANAPVYLTTGR